MVKQLYTVWVKIDRTLPWIELEGEYSSKMDARKAAEESLKKVEIKAVIIKETRKSISCGRGPKKSALA